MDLGVVARRSGRAITVREMEMRHIIDCIEPARRSARSAEGLCNAAATQFRKEAEILDEAADFLRSKLQTD